MGNEITNRANSYIASTEDYFAAVAAEASTFRDGGGVMFMKFDGNTGDYSYGADNTELPLGTLVAVNIQSYRRGWICWNDGEVVDEIMVPIHEGAPPKKHELPDHGPYTEDNDGWSEQYTIEFTLIEEPFLTLLFQANNRSKRIAFENMMKDFAKGFKLHEGCAPIIELDEREFEGKAKEGKRKYRKHAPILKIVDWKSLEELAALTEGSPDDYEEEDDRDTRRASRTDSRRDEEEDERPRRSARDRDEEEGTRSRSRRDEEEDDRPSRRDRAIAAARDEEEEEEDRRSSRADPRAGRRKPNFS